MTKRWAKLQAELNLSGEMRAANKKRVNRLVLAKLAALPEHSSQKGDIFMMKKFKVVIITLTVLILSCGTVLAASHFNLLNALFDGDTAYLQNAVQTPQSSVSDGKFTFTVKETLIGENQALIMYAIKAETPEAQAELDDDDFGLGSAIDFYIPGMEHPAAIHGMYIFKYREADTEDNTRHFILESNRIDNPEGLAAELRFAGMSEPNTISIDMTPNIITKTLNLGEDMTLKINAVGMIIEQHFDKEQAEIIEPEIFFRTVDGVLIPNDQIFDRRTSENENTKGGGCIQTIFFMAKTIIAPEKFEAIIIDSEEYSLTDGAYIGEAEYTE